MIVIISNSADNTTDKVIEYLLEKNVVFTRFNEEDPIKNFTLYPVEGKIIFEVVSGKRTVIKKKDIIWYRSGKLSYEMPIRKKHGDQHEYIKEYINREIQHLSRYFFSNFNCIGSYESEIYNNKLLNLVAAFQVGFLVPSTIVTTHIPTIRKFLDFHSKVITKPINNGHIYFENNEIIWLSKGTSLVKPFHLDSKELLTTPNLVQEYIEKEVELRIFVFEDLLYAVSIHSQSNEKTKIDFRNYDWEKFNRIEPFNLNIELKCKIIKFMKITGLRTGSIDLIIGKNGHIYFLEINPSGQFGWLSDFTFYNIERDIANKLIDMSYEK